MLVIATAASASEYRAKVDHVIDGDTVVLGNGDKVRLIGINAPENKYGTEAAQPYALEARLLLEELVAGEKVVVIPGQESRDQYGRLLAEIQLQDGTDVQVELLLQGYAVAVAIPPNIRKLDRYLTAEADARIAMRGVWRDTRFVVDLDTSFYIPGPGFRIIEGVVSGFYSSKNNYYFPLGDKLVTQVPKLYWDQHWQSQEPEEVVGQKYEIRGWILKRNENFYMLVSHPSMMVKL